MTSEVGSALSDRDSSGGGYEGPTACPSGCSEPRLVGRAARRGGAADPRGVPVRSTPVVPAGGLSVGGVVSRVPRRPRRREGLRGVGRLSRATGTLAVVPDARGPRTLYRRRGSV